ncbi:MAG: hypothetical protein ACM31C_23330 [Acidobacteriota bacterium]
MRSLGGLLALGLLASCGTDQEVPLARVQSYPFGTFTIAANQEISDQCVQITLNNDEDIYVNAVQLTGAGGFHHSNWDFVPAGDPKTGALGLWPGPDGEFTCADRGFDQAIGAQKGGTLFAQSTQAVEEVQQFPEGVALKIPAHSKLVSTIHLLNASDTAITSTPAITLTTIRPADVTTLLAAMAFEDHALGLPPNARSRFTVDCDLTSSWTYLHDMGTPGFDSPVPDFHVYYALAHYHKLGTGMSIEAVQPDNTSNMMFQTTSTIGDALGTQLAPTFDMTGYSRIRFSCDYYNNTDQTVGWGIGNQEMCVFLAFTDSTYFWGGGALDSDPPGPATIVDGVSTFSHACQVAPVDSTR